MIGGFASALLSSTSIKVFEKLVSYVVQLFMDSYQAEIISDAYVRVVMENLKVKTFEPHYLCEILLPACGSRAHKYKVQTREEFEERILADKPDYIQDNNFINNLYEEIELDVQAGNDRETILMYHFSDLHWNINYTEGSNNNCGEIVCCTPNSKPPTKESEKAGKWGDYNCDANPKVVGQLKYSFNQTGKPDFIVWTGDNPDHGIYKDPKISTEATVIITDMINAHSKNTTIFPIHGNHEFDPMNIQDFSLEVDPVIQIVANAWKHWMTEEANAEYLKQSFYSMMAYDHPSTTDEFKRKMGKTRIIGYNSNDCYVFNFMLAGEFNDPGQQFEWLENLLSQMEKDGEVGIFIGHMSPGTSDCISEVSSRLRVLFDRYQHILRLNLFGHTHNEEFEVIRSVEDRKPIGVNHLASSMTTFTNTNPSFRVITLDADTKLPLKIETHMLDIVEANKDDANAIFSHHHELTEDFNMEDLSPASFLKVTEGFMNDEESARKYIQNFYSSAPGYNPPPSCNAKCRRQHSCQTSNSVYSDTRKCMKWVDYTDVWLIASHLFDFMNGRWVTQN
uniref:Sphingomyelin phosphodiesterase n=1 Tax=Euplotes crassus TaxID=5936 RepID=A0A7S3NWK0_EUPCR|mmetsp:Transcript_38420/g.37937  ORF Transcript_38420/g.37937 Transcript_38420/m.37937 type:complete len:564 (+) Transcript_38420:135-1826(+)